MDQNSPQDNSYVMNPESAAELARLINQDQAVTRGIGGVLPERANNLSCFQDILDVACGPGGWVLDVAFAASKSRVVGIDISKSMTDYARVRARSQGLDNVEFFAMDITQPLPFPDHAFDLANARFLSAVLRPDTWQPPVNEMARVVRSGGLIRLTEIDNVVVSNSEAVETLSGLFARAMKETGRSFSKDGRSLGLIPMLGKFLHEAGCRNITYRAYAFDYSADTDEHEGFYQNFMVAFQQLAPILMKVGNLSQHDYDMLYQRALGEMMLPSFRAISTIFTVLGEKQQE